MFIHSLGFVQPMILQFLKQLSLLKHWIYKIKSNNHYSHIEDYVKKFEEKKYPLTTLKELKDKFPPHVRHFIDLFLDGYEDGQRNLTYFKKEFENCMK